MRCFFYFCKMRIWQQFDIENQGEFIKHLLQWGNKSEHFIFLNSNQDAIDNHLLHEYDVISACDPIFWMKPGTENSFDSLSDFYTKYNDWIFGYFSYDLKNEIESLESKNSDGLKFPEIYFYVPKLVFLLNGNLLEIGILKEFYRDNIIIELIEEIKQITIQESININRAIAVKQRIIEQEYIDKVEQIKNHIKKGDIYELNFCLEFYSENVDIKPVETYQNLNNISPAPFSVYLKMADKYLISSSPERFLAKRGNKITSQPIKGTTKRSADAIEDEKLKNSLMCDSKELSENVMIVDLVRNDLSKTAKKGSVKVEELCKIYTYPHVHQMVSTICSEMDDERFKFTDVIKNAFPMGSMTGAPKIKAMELIEKYENTKRGLYSGSVGYINPNGDFDFNVVIRSILYNSSEKYLSFSTGSAITQNSDSFREYEECNLKAMALKKALNCE